MKTYTYYIEFKKRCAETVTIEAPSEEEARKSLNETFRNLTLVELISELLRDRWKLRCLEMAGVDNWTWYDQAMSDYEADEYTNDELTKDYNEAN